MASYLHFLRMHWDTNVALMPYGETFRYHRKICQQNLRQEAAKNYRTIILQKVHNMLDGLLKSPEKFQEHGKMCAILTAVVPLIFWLSWRRLAVSIPLKTMYGYDVESIDDPCITNAEESVKLGVPLLMPGAVRGTLPSLSFYLLSYFGCTSCLLRCATGCLSLLISHCLLFVVILVSIFG